MRPTAVTRRPTWTRHRACWHGLGTRRSTRKFTFTLLTEEEISDVSLGTFYVFDKENAGKTICPTRLRRLPRLPRLRWLRRLRLLYLAGILPHLLSVWSFSKH